MKKKSNTLMIFIAMIAGIGVGYACHETWAGTKFATELSGYFSILTDIFLRLIKMIIALLVFSFALEAYSLRGALQAARWLAGRPLRAA